MAIYKNDQAAGRRPGVTPFEATGGVLRFEYVFSNEVLVNGDVLHLGYFPANKVAAVDATLVSDDLDGASAVIMSAGILSADLTTMGGGANDTWIASSNIGQTAGVARNTNGNPFLSGVQEFTQRPIGIVINTVPGTPQLAGKKVILLVNVTA